MTSDNSSPPYEPHIGETRQYWRDIILGVNDGLVSIYLLVVGVAGGGLDTSQVLLTGLAGALAGAVSMAAGEYLATKSQDEVLEAEMALERVHIKDHRSTEVGQLREMFADMGIAEDDLEGVVAAFASSDEAMLNAMKALEFGFVESERRSPYRAMFASGALFLVGSTVFDHPLHGLRFHCARPDLGIDPVPWGPVRGGSGEGPGDPQQLGSLRSREHDDRRDRWASCLAHRHCRRWRARIALACTRRACNS